MDGSIGPQVVFDFAGVLELCREMWVLADDLESYGTVRNEALGTALQDWRGPEADTMLADVHPTETQNLVNGISQLRTGAAMWAVNWRDAQQQHNNRVYQIAVKQEKDTRGGGEKVVDFLFGKDDSARHVPAPAASEIPTAPAFSPPTGFVTYVQYAHSDWAASYRIADSQSGGSGGGSW